MSLVVMTWKWGAKYPAEHVNKLAAGVARHYAAPHRFVCATDDPAGLRCGSVPIPDLALTTVDDGCYARLRTFDPDWQQQLGAGRIVWLDLDVVCVGDLRPLFDRVEPLVMLHKSHFNPCPVNGSILSVAAGAHPELWTAFAVEEARRIANADGTWRGSDQTWLAAKVAAPAWYTTADGVYAYGKPGWGRSAEMPRDARLVAFPGRRDPSQFMHLPWVRANWRA